MENRLAPMLRVVIFILIGLVILALIFAGFSLLKSMVTNNKQEAANTQQIKLEEFAKSGTKVTLINSGEIVAPENHITITVSVASGSRSMSVIRGYNQPPIATKNYPNNLESYTSFLSALSSAGYTSSQTANPSVSRSGSCPLGNRYSYQAFDASAKLVLDLWNNDCDSDQGTAAGDTSLIQELFELQIPDYDDVLDSVDL
jgi:hypothetical protein